MEDLLRYIMGAVGHGARYERNIPKDYIGESTLASQARWPVHNDSSDGRGAAENPNGWFRWDAVIDALHEMRRLNPSSPLDLSMALVQVREAPWLAPSAQHRERLNCSDLFSPARLLGSVLRAIH